MDRELSRIVDAIEGSEQAEEARREHEQRLALIVDSLPTRVVLFTRDGDVLHANRYTLDYAGVTLEELKSWKSNGLTHPDDREAVIAAFHASLSTGEPYDGESRHRRADGVYQWFHGQGFPLRDNDGQILLWYFLQTDIDERKRTEAARSGEKRLLEMVARGLPLPTVLDDLCRLVEEILSGCLCCIVQIDSSDMTIQWWGAPSFPPASILFSTGAPLSPVSGPCGMAAWLKEQVLVSDIASESRWTGKWQEQCLAHGLRSTWSTPILSRTQELLGTLAIHRSEPGEPTPFQRDLIGQFTRIASIAIERARSDVALKSSQESFRKSAALMAKVEQLSLSGSFCWRPATGELNWSEQLYRIFGIESGVPITMDMFAAEVHPGDLHVLHDMIDRARDGKDLEFDYRLLLPDGSVKYVLLRAHATRDPQGRLHYIGAMQDVTERRQSEEAVHRLRAELTHVSRVNSLGALTASIAHEINQPLAGIMTNANTGLRMLGAAPPNVEGALEIMRRTIRDGYRASEVITRLRALFRKCVVMTDAVDLGEAAHEVVELLHGEILRKRIVLRQEIADDLPPVTGDRVQLQQVVLNLLLNAGEAMQDVEGRPRQMVIRIERDDGNQVRFAVIDTGTGFEPQSANKLFDAFHTTKEDGMGIGLFVSRCIIENHGGHLWATPNESFGATFAFSIPCRPDGMAAADGPAATGQSTFAGAGQAVGNL
ncbi:PAS domain-containing protein [Cupriavidus necator]